MLRPDDTFRRVRRCDRYRPLYYAAASGDFNPLHLDPEVARRAGFPGIILQGMCTYGWLAEACTGAAGDPGALARLEASFSRPVAPGDEVTFEGRCAAIEDGLARLVVRVVNGRGEEVLKDARAEVRVGPAPAAPAAAEPPPAPAPPERYGPFTYEAGLEKIRDFALALSGGIPTRLVAVFPEEAAPHPWHVDERAARASPYGAVVAPPTFAAVYAMQPFAAAITDPANGIDLRRLVHGEQALRLHEVVRAGDRLTTTGGIASRVARGKLEILVIASRTVNQRGAVVTDGTWTALVRS